MAGINVKITDNSAKLAEALDDAVDKALTAVGFAAVSYAVRITPVDTGLARNSITFALHGEKANKDSYQSNGTSAKTGAQVAVTIGEYEGTATDKPRTVYIGSNVVYFPSLEEGRGGEGGFHMLRKALTEHPDEYKKLIQKYLMEAYLN